MQARPPADDNLVSQRLQLDTGSKKRHLPKHSRSTSNLLHPCCVEGCLLDTTCARHPPTPPRQPALHPAAASDVNEENLTPLLLHTASAARWRRRENNLSNSNSDIARLRDRANSELVLKVAVMEEVHGVDVSWLHHQNKGVHRVPLKTNDESHTNGGVEQKHKHSQSSPDVRRDAKVPVGTTTATSGVQRKPFPHMKSDLTKLPSPPNVTPPTPVEPTKDATNAFSTTIPPPSINKALPKRPGLLERRSQERVHQDASSKANSRRSSWMNSLSSKFSSSPGATDRPGPTPQQLSRQISNGPSTPSPSSTAESEAPVEEAEPYLPAKPKESSSSFFSSLTRRLSANSQTGGIPKVQGTGGMCARRVLNVDPNRERCLVPEMDPSRLRRVSFCVDVEIAGGPRYRDDDEDEEDKKKRQQEFKKKERAEGQALKKSEALIEEKDEDDEPAADNNSNGKPILGKEQPGKDEGISSGSIMTEEERDSAARKREKKNKSEAERKERKEKRRKRAEENGQIPVELSLDGENVDTSTPNNGASSESLPKNAQQPQPSVTRQDRPTTDPARIYRRCCQLRESPILKRITEQLSRPTCTLPQEPGVVQVLDLTGSRLQLADVISLGDWLAVVPVKHLKLEDADLSDEGVRCVLAGLLAAKKPEPTRRKSLTPQHRQGIPFVPHQERSGIVEKVTLKNNPRLTRVGWKHISLFLYQCRSLKTIDLSMNQFPETLPASARVTPMKGVSGAPSSASLELDAAEALYKCLSERLGGQKLDELMMSECGLTSTQIRKVVDGAIMAGVSRLGLASNHIDDEGLQFVLHYLRSNVCQALDIGGNDLRGKLDLIAGAINTTSELPCWGLSFAGCNLDSASLKPLFAVLHRLHNFRFLDLSHNRDLCADNGLIQLLRRYIGQMKDLKRIHLADVGMSPKQAIALADVLPEGPRMAHLTLLQNPQLTALANAKTEEDQEEACALYASLMASVRVSQTLICIDIDVPAADNSEVVKALAKQIVAYSLRNMEQSAIAEVTGNVTSTTNATSLLTGPHGGEKAVKDLSVPDVLMHLVGHIEGSSENHDHDPPAPDEDYIIGGAGVVKALQYVLGEKEDDNRRMSSPATPSGATTPRDRPGSSAGFVDPTRAKRASKNLLDSARKLRMRLQPALTKEASSGDELAYRRLQILDHTLQNMIERFEAEFPETRLAPAVLPAQNLALTYHSDALASTNAPDTTANGSDEDDPYEADEAGGIKRHPVARHNSDVSLAARALGLEEGRLHRIGQYMRREVIDSPRSTTPGADWAPWRNESQSAEESARLRSFGEKIEGISGVELKKIVDQEGWDGLLRKIGGTYEDLRALQEQDPEAWEFFKESQEKARRNLEEQDR